MGLDNSPKPRLQQIKTQDKHQAFRERELPWIKRGIVLGLFQVWFLWRTSMCDSVILSLGWIISKSW